MNKDRRKYIDEAIAGMDHAKSILENARDEEQDFYDNMPENMQGGDKGQAAEAAVSSLEDAISSIEEALSSAEESKNAS